MVLIAVTLSAAAAGHAIGFQTQGLVVGAGDHGFKMTFSGARDVRPQADAVSTDKARPLDRVTYADLWEGVTLDGAAIIDCRATANPSPDDAPAGVDFNHGFFSFTLDGAFNNLKIYLPPGSTPDTYYKYGPTPDDASDHWYEFTYDGYTGAEIDGDVITLHFIDAHRGDDIPTYDNRIVDIGGPGVGGDGGQTSSGSSGGGSGGCFVGSVLN